MTMKKISYLFTTLAFVLVFGGNAFGQIEVTASAELLSEITSSDNGTALNFGNLQTTFEEAFIDPTNSTNDTGVFSTTVQAARLTVSGATGATILINDPGAQVLEHTTSGDQLNLDPTLSGVSGDNINDRGGDPLTDGATLTLDGGDATLWFGGTLTPGTDGGDGLSTGTYETTFEVTINYM